MSVYMYIIHVYVKCVYIIIILVITGNGSCFNYDYVWMNTFIKYFTSLVQSKHFVNVT